MATIKRIVTSETQGRDLSDRYADNSYVYDEQGAVAYYATNGKMNRVMEPGKFYGAGEDSGDGNGLNTVKLIPAYDSGTDQYIIVDPTVPSHIHIRAGGTQDASNAELILGGEQAQVKVTDYDHQVRVSSYDTSNTIQHTWTFGSDGVLYGPNDGLKLNGGASGTFTSADNKQITVTNGVITDITAL